MKRAILLPSLLVTVALVVPASANAASACTKSNLALVSSGKLTVATDKPAYPPYFDSDKPANGKGFESALAYAIAKRLGFAASDVKWVVEPFNASYAPGKKKFDFDVNEISITAPRAKHVDFSAPYYTAPQAIVVPKGSKLKAKSLADLKKARIGVQIGTTSLDAVNDKIKPSQKPEVYNDSNDVVAALKFKRVDAVVVDLPTAFYITAARSTGRRSSASSTPPAATSGRPPREGLQADAVRQPGHRQAQVVRTALQDHQKWMGAAAGAPKLG